MSIIVYNLENISQAAAYVIGRSNTRFLTFNGELGAGKTTLIKAIIFQLGASDPGNSPTFGLVNEYSDKKGGLLAYHLDCYRLTGESEALDMGIEEYLDADCWVLVEWPEKIASLLPDARTEIILETLSPTERRLTLAAKYCK